MTGARGHFEESGGLSLARGKSGEIISHHERGSQCPLKKLPLLEWEFWLAGPKGPSWESFLHGELVQTAHFMGDEIVTQRN